ncbi:MAG: signal recognition particle-docking protein FtsY [Desulfobacterales bacterium]|nr:signal recognition particle-docking protein FtsY [Desulfobacterales bacterium]
MAFGWFKRKKKTAEEDPEFSESKEQDENFTPEEIKKKIGSEDVSQTVSEIEEADADEPEFEEPLQKDPETDEDTPETGHIKSRGFLKRMKDRLFKSRKKISGGIDTIFTGKHKLDNELLEDLEELLITSDIGVQTSLDIVSRIAKKSSKINNAEQLSAALKEELLTFFESLPENPGIALRKPHVILVVGVNGVGKTTTIGKVAAGLTASGNKVLISAADTFRAAASEQLTIWAERAGAEIVKHRENADPAAVVFDSIEASMARDIDYVLIDTAGRLHTKVNLMEEIKKIKRTITKKIPDAPHEILLVLDATTGQNALSQAKLFNEALGITGMALTKLDGTAKGGIVLGICNEMNIPLRYIGIGEQVEDLVIFEPEKFVEALF